MTRTVYQPCIAREPMCWSWRLVHSGLKIQMTLAVLLSAAACQSIDNPRYLPLKPDRGNFVTFVQPILGEHCASVACHGNDSRSLKLYAVNYLRAPPDFAEAPLDENHLTEAELTWNYDAVRTRLRGATSLNDCKLLLKCLAVDQGGIVHASGITVFASKSDPDYKLLSDWIDLELP